MKTQSSRNSRQVDKDYSSVCHQQGRMLTDSDLTEQALLSRDRLNGALRDVIGSGTPRHDGLLKVTEVGDDLIPSLHWGEHGGRVYVDGVPAEVRAADTASDADSFEYVHQQYYPEAPALPGTENYRLYVDVWDRSVTWLEDDMLRDPGLYGADTTARTQTVAQVKWCDSETDPLCPDINPPIGTTKLRLLLRSLATSADPCDPCAEELELNDVVGNYLFRAEVHDVQYDANDKAEALVLKWSGENGAEAYKTTDVPPDFAQSRYVYEFFDAISEMHLGTHLARDATNARVVDGSRQGLESTFSATSPLAKEWVRRWDGWCRIEKTGANWQVTAGFEGAIDLSSGVGSGKPGHVSQGGSNVRIELQHITLDLELSNHDCIAGDFWTTPVREAIHQPGDVLLEGEDGEGALPEGERHHYMLLVDVADGKMSLPTESECDVYGACSTPQFPSLTDLRAGDICYDNEACSLPETKTVQDALDHLCQQNDLPWHNKHLHGWGIVCGLVVECLDDNAVLLKQGYALDCDGRDMVIQEDQPVQVLEVLENSNINPEVLDKDQGVCLFLEYDEEQTLHVGAELLEQDKPSLLERLRETLLFDVYNDCILGFVNALRGEFQEADVQKRCAQTECGQKLVKPAQRRMLSLANLLFHKIKNQQKVVLNVSACEHALLLDFYNGLKKLLQSKTFCDQFSEHQFPEYPFLGKKACCGTWFTPEAFDHIRMHPDGKYLLGWKRNSAKVYVFEKSKAGCTGDIVAYFEVPQLENGTITDIAIDKEDSLLVSGIVHEEDSLLAHGRLDMNVLGQCQLKADWQTSFIFGVKIVQIETSPWKGKQFFYAVALCKGVYIFDKEKVFSKDKIEQEPDWPFPASGHMAFDASNNLVFATAFEQLETATSSDISCENRYYNQLAIFDGTNSNGQVFSKNLEVSDRQVVGNDGLVVAHTTFEQLFSNSRRSISVPVVYLVGSTGSTQNDQKVLYKFTITGLDKKLTLAGENYYSLGQAGHVALHYVKAAKLDGVIASRHNMHDMLYIPGNPKDKKKGLVTDIPLQAGPVDICANNASQEIFVLNYRGQSITSLTYALAAYQQQRDKLGQYRDDVIAAFYALLSEVVQYFKDCFCHHLLVECPECDEEDKVYLGCLSFKDNKVNHICNFTKRKYVKSFPTLSYWLSLVPIGPVVSWLVEELCCLILPELSRKRNPRDLEISSQQIGISKALLGADHAKIVTTLITQGQELVTAGLAKLVGTGYENKNDYDDMVVATYHYKPGIFKPQTVITHGNEYFDAKIRDVDSRTAKNQAQVVALKEQLTMISSEKQQVEERFIQLEADTDTEVIALKNEIAELKQEKARADRRFGDLEEELAVVAAMRVELHPIIEGGKSVSSIEELTPKNAKILEKNNIKTVKDLADSDVETLKNLGIHHATARSMKIKAERMVAITDTT